MAETRVSQIAVEIIEGGSPKVRVSQVATEVIHAGTPFARISQVAVEVLVQVATTVTLTKDVTADAFVGQTSTVQVTADATLIGEFTKDVTATGLVQQQDQTLSLDADAVVVNPFATAEVDADAVVLASLTKTVTAGGIVRATPTKEVTASARLVQVFTAGVDADALILPVVDVIATGLVLDTATVQAYGDALVRQTVALEVDTDAYVGTNTPIEVDGDGYLTGYEFHDVPASALVLETFERDRDGDAWLVERVDLEVGGDATLVNFGVASVTADATLEGTFEKEATAIGLVRDTFDDEVTADALLYYRLTAEITGDGVVAVMTTAIVGVFASAVISAAPVADVQGDALVTAEVGGGRLVSVADGGWDDGATWKVAVAERTDGTRLVGPGFTQPFAFVPAYATDATAIAVGLDLSSFRDTGGNLSLTLQEDVAGVWTVRATLVLTGDARAPFLAPAGSRIGWFLLPLSSPIALAGGGSFRVAAAGTGCNVVAGIDPLGPIVNGYVLNAVVVGSEVPGFHDGRPSLVCPFLESGAGSVGDRTVTVGSGAVGSAVVLGPGATLVLAPAQTVAFAVDTIAVGPGATLTMVPDADATHRIDLETGMAVDGTLTMTGQTKTRYRRLASPAASSDTVLALDVAPVGWAVGDRVFLGSTRLAESFSATVAAIAGTTLTLAGTTGAAIDAGALVVNETRSAEIAGGRLLPKTGSVLTLTNATLRGMRTGIALDPGAASCAGTDLVVVDGRLLGEDAGATGVRVGENTTLEDLTILRCRAGLVLPTDMPSPTGELVLAGFTAPDLATAIAAPLVCDVTGQDVIGGLVSLASGGRVTGTLDLGWGKEQPALVVATGLADAADLSAGALTMLAGHDGAVLRVNDGGGLGRLRVNDLTTAAAGAYLVWGAVFLGRGELLDCDLTGAPYLALVESDAGSFVDLVNFHGAVPETLVEGTLKPGSTVAHRDATRLAEGQVSRIDGDGFGSAECLELASDGPTLVWELDRLGVADGEAVTLGVATKGDGRVAIAASPVSAAATLTASSIDWVDGTLTVTATADGVLRIVAETEGTVRIDALRRL